MGGRDGGSDRTARRYLPQEWRLPAVTEESRAFFTTGELRLQRCRSCRHVQHPPGEVCINCQAADFEYVPSRPEGVVECVSVVHHPVHEMLRPVVPYNVVVVALDEHPHVRIVGNVVDLPLDQVVIGLPVVCTWVAIPRHDEREQREADAVYLPQWRARDEHVV